MSIEINHRLEALKLALSDGIREEPANVTLERAQQYAAFLSGEKQASEPTKSGDTGKPATRSGSKSGSSKTGSGKAGSKAAPAAEDKSSDSTDSAPGDADESSSSESGLSKEDVRAKLQELGEKRGDKNKFSMELLKKIGKADTMKGVDPANYQALYDAAEEAIADAEAGGGDEKDPLDD